MSDRVKSTMVSDEIYPLQKKIEELEQRYAENEEALDAIRRGTVDAFVIYGDEGERIYTLQGAETPYRILIESINEGAATLLEDGTILYCNRRFAEMLKAPLETTIGTSIHQYIPAENKESFSILLQRGLKENCREETSLLCNDSSVIPIMCSLNNINTSGYEVVCLIATDLTERKLAEETSALLELKTRSEIELRRAQEVLEKTNEELKREITEHRRTEEELQATQQTLQTVVDRMPAGIALIRGSDLRLILINPTYQAIKPGVKMVGSTLDEIFPETGQNYTDICHRVLKTGEPYIVVDELNVIRRTPDGPLEQGYFSWSLHRVRLPEDQGWGLLNSSWETTARKKTEEALNESQRKYQDLIETTGEFIWEMDREGRYTYCSPQMETLWGIKPDEMIGKTPFDIMPPDEKERIQERVIKAIESGAQFRGFTSTAYNSQGERIHIETSGNPFVDHNGVLLGYRGISRDITERMQAEEKLLQAYGELEQRVQERTRELVSVNEDLKSEIVEREIAEKKAISNAQFAEGLAQSAIALTSSLDLENVLQILLDQIRRVVPFQGAIILLLDKNVLLVAGSRGFEDFPDSLTIMLSSYDLDDYPLFQKILATRRPLLIGDTLDEPEWMRSPGLEWVRSYLAAPLIRDGMVNGIINLVSEQPGDFDQETVTRLMAFSAPASLAVQNARLYTAESRARQVAEAMSAMSQALTQTLDLDTILSKMLEHLPSLVSYDGAYIVTLEDESHLRLRATDGFESEANPKRSIGSTFPSWEFPYIEDVLTTQKSLLINDTQSYPGWETIITRKEIRGWLGVPILVRGEGLGIIGLVNSEPGLFNEEHIHLMESIANQVSIAIQNAWLFEQVQAGQERFQLLSHRLVEVQERERRTIVRELHDETSQSLTAIKFGLRQIEHDIDHPEKLPERVIEVKHLADEVLESLHRIAMNLRPASLDHVGLMPALEQLVKDFGKRYRLSVHFKAESPEEERRLPNDVETALYRIVQEGLTNIARHAHAKNVDVIARIKGGKVLIIVEDDGVGFDTGEIRERDKLGLIGMQERAQMMGGSLQIESSPNSGTTIVVEVNNDNPHTNSR